MCVVPAGQGVVHVERRDVVLVDVGVDVAREVRRGTTDVAGVTVAQTPAIAANIHGAKGVAIDRTRGDQRLRDPAVLLIAGLCVGEFLSRRHLLAVQIEQQLRGWTTTTKHSTVSECSMDQSTMMRASPQRRATAVHVLLLLTVWSFCVCHRSPCCHFGRKCLHDLSLARTHDGAAGADHARRAGSAAAHAAGRARRVQQPVVEILPLLEFRGGPSGQGSVGGVCQSLRVGRVGLVRHAAGHCGGVAAATQQLDRNSSRERP